jgi:hypothetical protein
MLLGIGLQIGGRVGDNYNHALLEISINYSLFILLKGDTLYLHWHLLLPVPVFSTACYAPRLSDPCVLEHTEVVHKLRHR